MVKIFVCALTLGLASIACDVRTVAAKTTDRLPNFVIIFTDVQGYGDLGYFGGAHVNTPRIDQMAAEGMKLTSFYVAAPVCTPSRAALMTGCYPKRVKMATGSNFPVLQSRDAKGLNPDDFTIEEFLKSAVYRTGMFGKWHLGDQPDFLSTRQGFDEFFGLPYSHDIHHFNPKDGRTRFSPLPLLNGETVNEMKPDAEYLTKRITERAMTFIERTNTNLSFCTCHIRFRIARCMSRRPIWPTYMEEVDATITNKLNLEKDPIDWSVGQILDTLKVQGLDENMLGG